MVLFFYLFIVYLSHSHNAYCDAVDISEQPYVSDQNVLELLLTFVEKETLQKHLRVQYLAAGLLPADHCRNIL